MREYKEIRGKNWNSGVIGIDTDRLRDRFARPAMIVTEITASLISICFARLTAPSIKNSEP